MNPFEMVLGIVLIGAIVSMAKLRHGGRGARSSKDDEMSRAQMQRISELEDRVRVLEHIVTDRGAELKREIDRL